MADGVEKGVGCRRAMGHVITGVEQKKKFKSKEQLGSLVKECVAKVEDELRKRNREFQLVNEAGEIGKDLYQPVVQQREELGEMEDVFEREELVEGNLELIGDGSVGMDEFDQSVELKCAREGGQLVNRRNVESRKGFPGGVKPVRWKLLGSRKPGTRTSELGQVRSPGGTSKEATEFASQANLAEDWVERPRW